MKKTLLFALVTSMLLSPLFAADQKIGGGDLTFTPKNAAPVTFSHDRHVREENLKCSACHNHIFQMKQGADQMDMSKINKGEFCGKCHTGSKGFDLKDPKQCVRCHKK